MILGAITVDLSTSFIIAFERSFVIQTYVRKKTLAAQKKEEAEKRQLSLGFDEQ